MDFYAKYCIECGILKEEKKGLLCLTCKEKRKKETNDRYRKQNPEKMKKAKRECMKRNPNFCVDCGTKIDYASMRCRKCAGIKRGRKITIKDKSGYILVWQPKHPNSNEKGYVQEHRLVVENFIGRYLTREEVIHHIDTNKENNKIDNLMLFSTQKKHMQFHMKIVQFGYTGPVLKQIEERWKEYGK